MIRTRTLMGMILSFLIIALSSVMYGCGSNTPTNTSTSVNNTTTSTISASPSAIVYTAPPIQGISNTTTTIDLSWQPVTFPYPTNYYDIYRATGTNAFSLVGGTSASKYKDINLKPNTKYSYMIKEYWKPVLGIPELRGQTPVASFTTLGTTPAPTGVTATAGDAQNTISWAPVIGATGYYLYYSTTANPVTKAAAKITGITANSYTHVGLTNGTTYYYAVAAISANGESINSATVSAKPQLGMPAAPTNITAVTQSTSKININWTAVSNATSYNIYRSTTPGFAISPANKIGTATAGPFGNTGLTPNTTYYYKVTAVNAVGESPVSVEVSATTLALPPAPTGLTATSAPDIIAITLNWMAVTGVSGYNVYRSTTPTVTITVANKINLTPVTTTSFQDTNLAANTTYYYAVTSVDNAGIESLSSVVAFATTRAFIVGTSWTTKPSNVIKNLNAVTWTGNQLLAVGNGGVIIRSSDATGNTWSTVADNLTFTGGFNTINIGIVDLYCVGWSQSFNQFTTAGFDGVLFTSTSGNAGTWTQGGLTDAFWESYNNFPANMPNVSMYGLAVSPYGSFYLAGTNGGAPVGPAWTSQILVNQSISYFNSGTGFQVWPNLYSVATNGTYTVYGGTDGLNGYFGLNNMLPIPSPVANTNLTFKSIVWTGIKFVGVANAYDNTTSAYVASYVYDYTPSTGQRILRAQLPAQGPVNSIAYSGNVYSVVGGQGTILNSVDGINWTTANLPAGVTLNNVIWTGNKFVAVGNTGTILVSQ